MRSAIKVMVIKDISVYLHWTVLLLIGGVLVASVLAGFNAVHLFWSVLFLGAVLVCVALHELAHAAVAARFGIVAKKVILLPIGGVASIEKYPDNPVQELAISLAGPVVHLLIAMSLSAFLRPYVPFWQATGMYAGPVSGDNFAYYLYLANIFLCFFNLIPAFPMDGGRILRALLAFRYNYVRATSLATGISKIVAWFIIVFGLVVFNPFIPLVGIFLLLFGATEEHYLRLKALVKGIKLREALMYDYNSLMATMTVGEAANILANNHSKYFIVMDDGKPVGSINRMEIIKALADMEYNKPLKELMSNDLRFFDGNSNLEEVLDKMSAHSEKIYPVLEDNRFAGVINFQHIIEYLLIHKVRSGDYHRVRSLAGLL